MAGTTRIRVPTLDEMESADGNESLVKTGMLFRREVSSKSATSSSTSATASDSRKDQDSPPKRMVSQKALLSRQPLSARLKSKISPKKTAPELSPKDSNDVGRGTSSVSTGLFNHKRISKVTTEDAHAVKSKTPSVSIASDCTASSSSTALTSKWTGSVLGTDSRNASVAHRPVQEPGKSTTHRDAPAHTEQREGSANRLVAATNLEGSNDQRAEQDVRADVLPILAKVGKTNSLVVSSRQRGNPILNFVRNVPWEYGNIVPDYVMGQSNCALYLSLRYHQLHPDYIHNRLQQLGRSFDLRVLLVQVDIKDPHHLLKDLAKICILADCTLMLAFSAEEAGRYLETYKIYENKAAEAIMEREDSNFNVQLSDCLSRVKAVNKTDCSTLLTTFGNLQGIMEASSEDLSLCPGFGPQKAKRLHNVFREPFLVSKKHRPDTAK